MYFNSLVFFLFFFLVFLTHWTILRFKNINYSNLFILFSSYIFYSFWDWRLLSLIFLSSTSDYIIGNKIYNSKTFRQKKNLLILSLTLNLGLLFIFKYFNFFIKSFNEFLNITESFSLNIILPVGISFYTFQTLSYTIDIYNNKLKPTNNIISFLTFVSFFPQLVAGPIERASNLLPQFNSLRKFNFKNSLNGISLISYGFFKKIVIADRLGIYVDSVFDNIESFNSLTLILASLFFSFQIYCDFSGYSLIARGLAKLLGFDLMVNFNKPYLSTTLRNFWKNWHISLSTWFRDYLYIPLGGSNDNFLKVCYNLFIVFIISGMWHGANWTFIYWGAFHGLFLIIERILKRFSILKLVTLPKILKILTVFLIVNFLWVFFRAQSIDEALIFFNKILELDFSLNQNIICAYKGPINLILSIMLIILLLVSYCLPNDLNFKKPNTHLLFNFILVLVILFLGINGQNEFIYFQF